MIPIDRLRRGYGESKMMRTLMTVRLRRADVPVLVVVNKVDTDATSDVPVFLTLGLGDPFPVSALHGGGGRPARPGR